MEICLRDVERDFREQLAPAIERVWHDEIARVRGDLRGWVLRVAEAQEEWVPALVEFAFGLPRQQDRDAASTETSAALSNGYQLRGVIDCVERKSSGNALRVTDYKTGKNRLARGAMIQGGELLQTVLYPLAMEALGHGHVDHARLAFCTADGGYSQVVTNIDERARAAAEGVLHTIDKAIEEVFLPAAPRKDGCRWCDFLCVCGPYEELRASRKDQNRLGSLKAVREMP
jgi:CRISPR/Cas system-associated exonuclease Cas4 (RecB family)